MSLVKRVLKLLKSNIIIPIACVAIVLAVGIGGAYASFLNRSTQYSSVTSPAFYFESDFLTVEGKTYNVSATSVTFLLKNNADDLRFADNDITYTLSTTGGTLSATGGILAGGTTSSVTITLEDLVPGQEYTVTATANAGYEKTLKATFCISEPATKLYMNTNVVTDVYTGVDTHVLLTVWSENITGDVSVAFPAGLIPDNTDPVMAGVENLVAGVYVEDEFVDTATFAAPHSSHVYRFFITTDYDKAVPFEVTMDVGGEKITAIEKSLS